MALLPMTGATSQALFLCFAFLQVCWPQLVAATSANGVIYNHATHRLHKLSRGLKVEVYHPPSVFEVSQLRLITALPLDVLMKFEDLWTRCRGIITDISITSARLCNLFSAVKAPGQLFRALIQIWIQFGWRPLRVFCSKSCKQPFSSSPHVRVLKCCSIGWYFIRKRRCSRWLQYRWQSGFIRILVCYTE